MEPTRPLSNALPRLRGSFGALGVEEKLFGGARVGAKD